MVWPPWFTRSISIPIGTSSTRVLVCFHIFSTSENIKAASKNAFRSTIKVWQLFQLNDTTISIIIGVHWSAEFIKGFKMIDTGSGWGYHPMVDFKSENVPNWLTQNFHNVIKISSCSFKTIPSITYPCGILLIPHWGSDLFFVLKNTLLQNCNKMKNHHTYTIILEVPH